MKKRGEKTSKTKLEVPQSFKDIKFNRSFIVILLALLIILLAFTIYIHNSVTPIEEDEEVQEETAPDGHECTADMDCAQPRCYGMKAVCENGFCIIRQVDPSTVRCIDLKAPVCGNDVCEGDEKDRCPEDC